MALAWYEHGTRFVRVAGDGQIAEDGWFLGSGGQASAAYWITDRVVYVADYIRGLDVLRFEGDVGGDAPPAPPPPAGGGTENPMGRRRAAIEGIRAPQAPSPASCRCRARRAASGGAACGSECSATRPSGSPGSASG